MFNARVHYTVLTQHPTPTNNHEYRITTAAPRAGYNQGTMPQTPNNAPSTHPYAINACVLVNPPFWLRCISTRLKKAAVKQWFTQPPTTQQTVWFTAPTGAN